MKSNDYQRNTGLDDRFKQTKGDRLDDIIFSKNYAETISEIINFDDVSDDIRQLYQESITGDNLKKPSISYVAEDRQKKNNYIK